MAAKEASWLHALFVRIVRILILINSSFFLTLVSPILTDPKVLQIILVLVLPIVLAIVIVAILIFIKCRPGPEPVYNERRYTLDEVSDARVFFCFCG